MWGYKTVTYFKGYRTVYGTEPVREWKNGRWVQEIREVPSRRVPIYGRKRVRAGYHYEDREEPNWVTEKVQVDTRVEERTVERWGCAQEKVDERTVYETVPRYVERRVRQGEEQRWVLEKIPPPPPPVPAAVPALHAGNKPPPLPREREISSGFNRPQMGAVPADYADQVVPLDQKEEKGFFERAAGWVQEKIRGLGEAKELARSILAATLGPLGDELKSWADPEEHPILAGIHGRGQRTWEGLRQGAIGAYELTKYMLMSAWEGRWGDAARAWRAWERAPEEIGNAVLDEYEQASMVEQALLGVVAVGDLLDIGVELRKIGRGEKPDLWVLGLAAGGVVLDALAWMNGPLPDPADGANIFVSAIKTLLRNMPDGRSRRLIQEMLTDPKQWTTLRALLNSLRKNQGALKALIRDDEALYIVLKNGPEAVELMAKYGDEGVALVAKYGDDGYMLLAEYGSRGLDVMKRADNAAADAYEVAKNGGRHAGTIANYSGRSPRDIEKSIRGYHAQVVEHMRKMSNPEQYISNWSHLSLEAQERILRVWERDIIRNRELEEIMRRLLQEVSR
jgi:hypothetical protein